MSLGWLSACNSGMLKVARSHQKSVGIVRSRLRVCQNSVLRQDKRTWSLAMRARCSLVNGNGCVWGEELSAWGIGDANKRGERLGDLGLGGKGIGEADDDDMLCTALLNAAK